MAGGGGRDRIKLPGQQKPVGVTGAAPGNSAPYVPGQSGGKPQVPQPQPQTRPQRPQILTRQGPPMSPPFVPGMPAPQKPDTGVDILQGQGRDIKPGMGGGKPPIFQAEPIPFPQQQKPAWQQLRDAGIQGQGSAAGNRQALSRLGGSVGGPAMGDAGPIDNIGGGGGGMAGMQSAGQGIDGAIASLRQQLGGPQGAQMTDHAAMRGIQDPRMLDQWRSSLGNIGNGMTRLDGGTFNTMPAGQGYPAGAGPAYGPGAGSLLNPGNFGGPGSDLGFQSGGGFMGAPQQQQAQNPYLNILRQRLARGGTPGSLGAM